VLFQLVRSTGFDRWWARGPILLALGVALRTRWKSLPRLGELYATMLDARTIRPGDRRAVRRLLAGPRAEQAEILLRVTSIEKLHGELDAAVRHGEQALRDAERHRRPRLAAMAVYNLAWTYRQRGEFERRAELVARYEDRMPHIGFNWAAWLGLDEVLVALHFGDALRARTLMDGATLEYARSLIRHPAYGLDDDLTGALVRWHEDGPAGIDELLVRILEKSPVRRFAHPPFTAVDTLIVLADHARATGESRAMQRRLRRARRGTSSDLQLGEIELVEAVAASDRARLERFREDAERRQFGLLARSAEAVLGQSEGGPPDSEAVFYRPSLPLAGLY
jgi:tetratricopeptide (TPR) repeat protein